MFSLRLLSPILFLDILVFQLILAKQGYICCNSNEHCHCKNNENLAIQLSLNTIDLNRYSVDVYFRVRL